MFWYRRTNNHSNSSNTTSAGRDALSPTKTAVLRSKSANQVPTMASPATLHTPNGDVDPNLLNTIPDPRTPSPTLRRASSDTDIGGEVAVLSTKLINAINHSTGLEDSLQHIRQELESARRRVEELEEENARHVQDVAGGVLLKKAEVDTNMQKLREEMNQVRLDRETAEKAKKQMEAEVENLTASLFDEANTVCLTPTAVFSTNLYRWWQMRGRKRKSSFDEMLSFELNLRTPRSYWLHSKNNCKISSLSWRR